jgi:hypothetical protein
MASPLFPLLSTICPIPDLLTAPLLANFKQVITHFTPAEVCFFLLGISLLVVDFIFYQGKEVFSKVKVQTTPFYASVEFVVLVYVVLRYFFMATVTEMSCVPFCCCCFPLINHLQMPFRTE